MPPQLIMLPAILLVCCSATDPDEPYRQGGKWVVTLTPLELPNGAKVPPSFSETKCLPTLGWDAFPKVGRVQQYRPGFVCTVTETSAKGDALRWVEMCTLTNGKARLTTEGPYSATKYSLTITTEDLANPAFRVVVREDGELKGPCTDPPR